MNSKEMGEQNKRLDTCLPRLRRALPSVESAQYLSLTEEHFMRMVNDGRMPRPRIADGKRLWDVEELDFAYRELPREGGGSIADFLPRATGQRRTRKETLANPKIPPAAYSVKMLAEKLGCSRTHVYHLIRNGQIKTFRFGELIRIPAAELERLQSASFVEQPSPDKPNQEPTFSKPFKPWLHER